MYYIVSNQSSCIPMWCNLRDQLCQELPDSQKSKGRNGGHIIDETSNCLGSRQ